MKIIFSPYVFILTELLLDRLPKYKYTLKLPSLMLHKNILESDYNKRGLHIKNMLKRINLIKGELINAGRIIEISYNTKKDEKKTIKIKASQSMVITGIKNIVNATYNCNGNINITDIINHLLISEMVPRLLNTHPLEKNEFNSVIPIGNRCILAGILRGLKLHGASLPFDNLASSPRLLQPFFDKGNVSDYYLPYNPNSNSLLHNGLHFGHFDYKKSKVKHTEITNSFNRKFERLFSILEKPNNNVLFVFADSDSLYKGNNTSKISQRYYEELKEFDKFISSKYKIKYNILCFHVNEQFSDTGNIKNYTVKLGHNENRNNLSGFYNLYGTTGQRYLWHLFKVEIQKILRQIKVC